MTTRGRTATQYRIRVKREGCQPKDVIRWSERAMRNRLLLLGPEPWKAYNKDPDDRLCCDGHECGCMGSTVREEAMSRRKNLPKIESIEVCRRVITLGPWEKLEAPMPEVTA